MEKIHFYGLLHLSSTEKSAVNVRVNNFLEQIKIYKKNAITCARTLSLQGLSYTLLTNRPDLIDIDPSILNVVEIPFSLKVPNNIGFYSAHFKIDAFNYISKYGFDYSILCDLDVVCINDIPKSFINICKSKIPMCYDISDQVIPAYGLNRIVRDLEFVKGTLSEGKWYGGELIGGPPEFFKKLYECSMRLYPKYINNLKDSHHVGDEAIISPALEVLKEEGNYISDVGTIGIISRFWNSTILHPQKPFEWSENCFLLHLPADKIFLSNASEWSDLQLKDFVKIYHKYMG